MKDPRRPPRDRYERVKFRRARLCDLPELLRLVRAYYRFDGIRFQADVVDAALRKLLRSPSLGRVWIMRDGAKAVGYLVLTLNYDLEFGGFEGIVTDLFIRSPYRAQGLGRRALALVYDHCRLAKIGTVELQVKEGNRDAQAFYRRLGFRTLPRIIMSREMGDAQSR